MPRLELFFFTALLLIIAPRVLEAEEDDRLTGQYQYAFERCNFGAAAAVAREQLEERRQEFGEEDPRVARSMVRLARVLVYVPDDAAAESLYRDALAIEVRSLGPRHETVAATMGEFGVFLAENGRWDEADSLITASLDIRRTLFGDWHAEVARGMLELGKLHYATHQWFLADSVLTEALAMERDLHGPDSPSTLEAALQLGKVLSERDFVRAMPLLEDTLRRLKAQFDESDLRVAACYTSIATIEWNLRRLEQARQNFQRSLAIKQGIFPDGHPLVADELNNLGVLCMTSGEFTEGEHYLREAVTMYREFKGDDHEDVAYVLSNLAVNLSEQRRFAEAAPVYEECRAIYRAIDPTNPDLLWVTSYEGRDALNRGDYEHAESCFQEVVDARLGQEPPDLLVINELRFLAQIEVHRGEMAAAAEELERAALVWEYQRRMHGTDVDRATATLSPYVPCALARLEAGDGAGAWRAIERARGRVIADMIVEKRGAFPGTAPDDSLSYVFSLERIQRALGPDAAIVGWIDDTLAGAGPRSWAYVIRNRGPVAWERLEAGTDSLLQDLRDGVAAAGMSALGARHAGEFEADAAALYDARFEAIERHLQGVHDVVVIPSAATSDCPVELLRKPGGRYLADRYALSYAPSATIATWLREREGRVVQSGLLIGDPPFNDRHLQWMASGTPLAGEDEAYPLDIAMLRSVRDGDPEALASLPRLRWSREEVAAATRYLPEAEVLLGRDANAPALKRICADGRLDQHDVIHLATHAFVDPRDWKRCALVLAQVDVDDTADGLVSGGEVASEWSLDAELVVLSACETGRGQPVPAEGTVGFTQPFLVAGARGLLVSLWKVDDRATALLMGRFYENWLGKHESKADALRDARMWLRSWRDQGGEQPYRHPYYWSSFVLIGDGR